jgi:hypothetical protein
MFIIQHSFLSYLNETTESRYKYATTHEDQSLLNQFLPARCTYFRLLPISSKQALYPIKLLVNFILPYQLVYFSP